MPVKWKTHAADDLLFGMILFAALQLLMEGKAVSAAAAKALLLCGRVLLPSLFPFFVLSSLLISSPVIKKLSARFRWPMRHLFGLPGCCAAAVFLGAVGGYPVGAKAAVSLYRQRLCTKAETVRLLSFCNNAGPAFFISALGIGLLGDRNRGVLLYLIHLTAAVLIGLFQKREAEPLREYASAADQQSEPELLSRILHAVSDSFLSFLNVCGFVLFFAILLAILHRSHLAIWFCGLFPAQQPLLSGMLSGFAELSSGCASLSGAGLDDRVLLPALSFICGFGGISVQCQSVSILHGAGLPARRYLCMKLLHGGVACLLALLCCM